MRSVRLFEIDEIAQIGRQAFQRWDGNQFAIVSRVRLCHRVGLPFGKKLSQEITGQ